MRVRPALRMTSSHPALVPVKARRLLPARRNTEMVTSAPPRIGKFAGAKLPVKKPKTEVRKAAPKGALRIARPGLINQ